MTAATKHRIAICAFGAYLALVIKAIVFKFDTPIRIGHMHFRFAAHGTGPANFIPFETLTPFLHGRPNHLIAAVNLFGNTLPFIPLGLLAPFAIRNLTWPRAIALAIGTGLLMEVLEVLFRTGVFDVDDILLNAIGVLTGYTLARLFR